MKKKSDKSTGLESDELFKILVKILNAHHKVLARILDVFLDELRKEFRQLNTRNRSLIKRGNGTVSHRIRKQKLNHR